MKHILFPHHHEHLKKIGIPDPPKHVEISDLEYREHYANWKRTHPEASHEELHKKVIAHVAWKQQSTQKEETPVVVEHRHVFIGPKVERYIIIGLLLLLALLLFKGKAHAQFSHVDYVNWQASGTNISGAFFTYPFNINCLSTMTCTVSGNTLSISSNSGGTGCTLQGGTNLLLYDTSTACNDITKWSTNGTTTITAAATAIFDARLATSLYVPSSGGCAPTVSALACYDSTNHLWVFGSNGATVTLCPGLVGGVSGQVFESNGGTSCGGYADPIVSGPDAPGAASTKNPVQVAGNDGTDVRAIATDSSGNTKVVGAGTAGSASGGVVTVQGVASMTKLLVTPDSVALPSHQSVNVDEIGGSALAIGQQLAAASIPVILPSATITTLTPPTPPTAAAIGTSVSGDLLIGTQVAASSVPVALPSATITTLTPVTAAAIASAIVSNPPTVPVTQATGSNLHMVCDSGCSSSAGFADNSAFTVGTTAINPLGGLYDTGADPSISNGNAGRARIDSHSYLLVDGSQVTQPVSGTFWQATQPVSGTFWQTTQPVSGSGVFEVGPTTSANTVSNPFFFQLGNGTNNAGLNGTTYTSTYGLNTNILGLDGAVFSATHTFYDQISDGTNAMGAMANYGTAPSAVKALNANVYVTNTPDVNIQSNASVSASLPGNAAALSGQQAVTASAVALATNTSKNICVKALVGNTINVYVGPSGITDSTGMELAPGDSVCLPVQNTNLLYVIASTTGASVSWIGTN